MDDLTSGVGFRPGHSHGLDSATGEWRPFPFADALVEQADATLQLVADAVQDTLREDLGHGWTLMELARMLHIIDPDKRWRAIAEKLTHPGRGGDIAYGWGPTPAKALADLWRTLR